MTAMVARPVGSAELKRNAAAQEAVNKEWDNLRRRGVWKESNVRERADVIAEAKAAGREVQFGRVHCICVEKNSELPLGDPKRRYKGRAVFLGNQVVNQDYQQAMFAELGNAPASMEAARLNDWYACLPGHSGGTTDGVQAYCQARLLGVECWIALPWTAVIDTETWRVYGDPVTILEYALYGHVDSPTSWEVHCDAELAAAGFDRIGAEWPSVYFHHNLRLLLTVYVDDFKLSGPEGHLDAGWKLIAERIEIEPPTPFGLYLGVRQHMTDMTLPDGSRVRGMEYEMTDFLKQCVQKYRELADFQGDFPQVGTPFLSSESEPGPARAPAKAVSGVMPGTVADEDEGPDEAEKGELASVAAQIVMKVLYAARAVRLDLLRAVQGLARCMTKWTRRSDAELFRLIAYIDTTVELRLVGWVGDEMKDIHPHLYSDADFAG